MKLWKGLCWLVGLALVAVIIHLLQKEPVVLQPVEIPHVDVSQDSVIMAQAVIDAGQANARADSMQREFDRLQLQEQGIKHYGDVFLEALLDMDTVAADRYADSILARDPPY